jgi:osmotically inducible protein OsmC
MERSSTVLWHGTGKEGSGKITSQSGVLANVPYAWNTRFGENKGTNPEELLAAAHASCFTMKLSFLISDAGYEPEEITTTASVKMEDGKIAESHLLVKARIQRINEEEFLTHAEKAKNECPMSRALNVKITMDASIESLTNA